MSDLIDKVSRNVGWLASLLLYVIYNNKNQLNLWLWINSNIVKLDTIPFALQINAMLSIDFFDLLQ